MSRDFLHFYKRLYLWLPPIIGVLLLGALAYLSFYIYQNIEVDKSVVLVQLDQARQDNYDLIKMVQERDHIIESFQGQIGTLSSTVGTLEKLSQTDEELLKKYSKVYFLNENYSPPSLIDIDEKYVFKGSTNFLVYAKIWPYLRNLLQAAHSDGVNILVASAYRSFDTQSSLKANYKVLYGSGANQFSADQGYSEHQLGTALDFTTAKLGAGFAAFAADPAYLWLQENAYKYGFILSYPPNNAYYKFEPWHWRFVGKALATKLHQEGKYFYDLDQRDIDDYLIKIFE